MRDVTIERLPGDGVRPKLDENSTTERVQLVAPASWMKKVDDWRRLHPDLPNRSAAIRMLVEQALATEKKDDR